LSVNSEESFILEKYHQNELVLKFILSTKRTAYFMRSVRHNLISILNRVASAQSFPVDFSSNSTLDEIKLVSDLIDQSYLSGDHTDNEVGVPSCVVVTGITLAGRHYVEQLENEQFNASSMGKTLTYLKYAAVFMLGIIGTLVSQWLAKRLGLK
jgi:hypothetical protein